jgi:hypothetical protein
MSLMLGLRILAVVLLGWVVAHAALTVLKSIAGHERRAPRELVGEALTGLGAFAIGWGLLPGGPSTAEDVLFVGGVLVWVVGGLIQPMNRAPSGG